MGEAGAEHAEHEHLGIPDDPEGRHPVSAGVRAVVAPGGGMRLHAAPPLLAGTIQFLNEAAGAQGLGTKDTAAMWEAYRSCWGTRR